MIVASNYKGIHEKVLRARNGQLVRVCFSVAEYNGEMRGQIISVTPILELAGDAELATSTYRPTYSQPKAHYSPAIICLPCVVATSAASVTPILGVAQPSPYYSLDFFMSQPTRAPSRV